MEMFGFDTLFVIGKPNISHGYSIQHKEYVSLDQLLSDYPNAHIVALTGEVPEGHLLTDLTNYIHPTEDVIYVIGGDYSGLDFAVCDKYNPDYVKISGTEENPNLWSFSVASILMYHQCNG